MNKKIKNLKDLIRSKLNELTQSQKIIAGYIIENPEKFALSSIREIEKELCVSKSTIVRFSQALGYSGFFEFKSKYLSAVRQYLDPINRYKSYLSESNIKSDYLKLIYQESSANIQKTLSFVDKEQYNQVINLLKNADHVYTMGLGMSRFLAEIASYLLNRISVKSDCMANESLSFVEKIINISPDDLILAFAFPSYSEETIQAASYAYEKNIKVVSITDKMTSEIIQYSSASLQVVVESIAVSNSMMSVLVILYAIVSQLGHDRKDKTLETIESITYIRELYKHSKK